MQLKASDILIGSIAILAIWYIFLKPKSIPMPIKNSPSFTPILASDSDLTETYNLMLKHGMNFYGNAVDFLRKAKAEKLTNSDIDRLKQVANGMVGLSILDITNKINAIT